MFAATATVVNDLFALTGISDAPVCRLEIGHFIWFLGATMAVAGLSALFGGVHVVRIDPSESLRTI